MLKFVRSPLGWIAGALLIWSAADVAPAVAQATMKLEADGLPAWAHEVGARRQPSADRVFSANTFGAVADTTRSSTAAIQQAIDAAFRAGGGVVTLEPGRYVTGALFVKSNVHLRIDPGVTLLGSQDDADYPSIWTRVAGIEMYWPAALINVNDQQNVKISGGGTIDGRGQKWWDKYWSMRRNDYEPRGLRWAVDYDAERARLMVVWRSKDVTVENLTLKQSGFWTVQVVYSDHVTVDGVIVRDNQGPSTDGVNIDSSSRVLVQNTDIDNNDDNICLKSGRDWDGMRVGRPAEYVVIRNNVSRRGGGVLCIGSETSGGIRHVVAYNNRGIGTKEGVRFKSAKTRGGVVEDILIRDLTLENVPIAFSFTLNWNPSYSYATLPDSMRNVPDYWVVMNTPLPADRALPEFRNVTIENVRVAGARRVFSASGLPEKMLSDFVWRNIDAQGQEAGFIEYARDWEMDDVRVRTPGGEPVKITNSDDVEAPRSVPVGR